MLRLLSIIAPTVKRRAPERVYWSGDRKAERDSRFTPAIFLNSVYRAFGPINLDPCGHRSSPVVADRRFLIDEGDNGLTDPWSGRLVFVNPPYFGYLNWLQKAYDEWAAGNVGTVVCLVPVRTDSPLFHDFIRPKADLYFLRKRLHFGKEGGKPEQTPHSLMVVIFGATARQKALFASLVRGFWAPANDRHFVSTPSITADTQSGSSLRTDRVHMISCGAAARWNGRHPVRVFCGPSVRHRGEAR